MGHAQSFDVALSFAGEDRSFAEALAAALVGRGVRVFYDRHQQAVLWGKDLYQYLTDLYQRQARFCVVCLSRHYAQKLWTRLELKAAQARAFAEHQEYLLPVRLDDTDLPGVLPTVAYMQVPPETPATIAEALLVKLGGVGAAAARAIEGQSGADQGPAAPPIPSIDRFVLYDALCAMLPAQFAETLFRLRLDRARLLPEAVPQAQRAIEVIERLEQPGAEGLAAVDGTIKRVAPHLLGAG